MQNMDVLEESPIHGDLLEVVLAHVPLIDLAYAYRVSKSWEYAVLSSLLHLNKAKPWLIIHTQCGRSLNQTTIQAFDPRSNTWIEINSPVTTKHESFIHTSSSNLLYKISTKQLSYSTDPLHITWTHISPPRVWRVDPIVAKLGPNIVVAGGVSEFEDDPLSVEMYNVETCHWYTCQSMPDILKHSAASTWLSVASDQNKMYLTEKASGITYSFNPKTKSWSGPYDLRPDAGVFISTVGFAGNDLIFIGVYGHAENADNLKIWKIKPELMEFNQIGEIPSELLEKLKGNDGNLTSISIKAAENFIFMYNTCDPDVIVYFENGGGEWRWHSQKNMAWNDERRVGEIIVMSCQSVTIGHLHMTMKSGTHKFSVKSH